MNISQILQSKRNRAERFGRPFNIFHDSFDQCAKAGQMALGKSLPDQVSLLVERSAVISTVTAIEVFYKDMLAICFRACKPDYYEPHLKQLHTEKFDIGDLIEFEKNGVHPLDIVLASQSFQNIERIDRVFSKFLPKSGLWGSIIGMKVRLKEHPDNVSKFEGSSLEKMKRLFDLRHELVHDPVRRSFFTHETLDWMYCSAHLVMGSHLVWEMLLKIIWIQ